MRRPSIGEILTRSMLDHSQKLAVISSDGALSYEELHKKSDRLNRFLDHNTTCQDRPFKPTDVAFDRPSTPIILFVSNHLLESIAITSLVTAGRVGLVVSIETPLQQIAKLGTHSPFRYVLTDLDWKDSPEGITVVGQVDGFRLLEINFSDRPPLPLHPECRWTLLTSGSTGEKKIVQIDQENLTSRVTGEIQDFDLRQTDRIACFLSFSHDLGLNQLLTTLSVGATLCLHRFLFAEDLLRKLDFQSITGFTSVPGVLRRILLAAESLPQFTLSSLRFLTISGGSLSLNELKTLRQLFPTQKIIRTYGKTETFRSLRSELETNPKEVSDVTGFPLADVSISLDANGELIHRGAGTMLGYYSANGEGADSALGHRTGDYFCRVGDAYKYLGRHDDMIKVRDLRIYPQEIEHAIVSLDTVADACVVPTTIESPSATAAFIVLRSPDSTFDVENLNSELREQLPDRLIPTRFIICRELPRLASGKTDRTLLQKRLTDPLESPVKN